MKFFWGLLIILIGLLLLANNFNIWTNIDWDLLWQFWPVLIILYGLALLVKGWRFGGIIIIAAFIIVGALIGLILITQPEKITPSTWVDNSSVSTSRFSSNVPSNAKEASINIKTGAVNLDLQESPNKLIEGNLESNIGKANLNIKASGEKVQADLQTNSNRFPLKRIKNDLLVKITNSIPVKLNIDAGASSLNIDLRPIILRQLNISSGATSMNLKIGDKVENNAKIKIDAGASSIKISLPESIGTEIKTSSALASREFEGFNKINDRLYRSSNYDQSAKKISLEINAGASSIKVEND